MDWGTIIGVGAQLVGGLLSSNTASRNSSNSLNYAIRNADSLRNYGRQQATLTMWASKYNSELIQKQAKINVAANKQIAGYNAGLLQSIANYNSLLYSSELDSIYEAAELDTMLRENMVAKAKGTIIAQQGGSGTVIGTGSNADVVSSIMAEGALDQLVADTNVRNQAISLVNKAAQGDWEAKVQGQKLMWEAEVGGWAEMLNASLQSQGSFIQGSLDAWSQMTSADNRAKEALLVGQQQSDNSRDRSNYYLWQGGLGALTTVASNWDSLLAD